MAAKTKKIDTTEREPFTDTVVKALSLPEKGSKIYFDPALPGFGVRVTANGARAYCQ
jgi:hypothetical protein